MRDADDIAKENDRKLLEGRKESWINAYQRVKQKAAEAQTQGIPFDFTLADKEGKKLDMNIGWKLHLNVDRDVRNPLTRRIAAYLFEERPDVDYKIGNDSDQDGKGMTIYVGDFDSTMDLAQQLHSRFGSELHMPGDSVKGHDKQFVGNIWGRFNWFRADRRILAEKYGITDPKMTPAQYGSNGITYTEGDQEEFGIPGIGWGNDGLSKAEAEKRGYELAKRVFGAYFTGKEEYSHDKKWWQEHPANPEKKPTHATNTGPIPDWMKDNGSAQDGSWWKDTPSYGTQSVAEKPQEKKGVFSYLHTLADKAHEVADKILHRRKESNY